jgi:hypothetical protein
MPDVQQQELGRASQEEKAVTKPIENAADKDWPSHCHAHFITYRIGKYRDAFCAKEPYAIDDSLKVLQ